MQTVADILIYAARRTPHQNALFLDGQGATYEQLLAKAQSVGTGLQAQGLRRGDCILTLLQNHLGAATLHWAAQLYGIIICPINWRTTSTELAYFAKDCGAKAIFYDASSEAAVTAYKAASGVILAEAPRDGWRATEDVWPNMSQRAPDPLPEISEDDVSVILYTSGTTGPGKGVPRSHRAERAASLAHVAQNALFSGDIALGVMPLYHTMGVRLLLSTALLSGSLVCQPKFEPRETLKLIAAHDIASLYLVPTLYHDLLIELENHPQTLASICRLGFAGASMSDGLLQKLAKAFPGVMTINHYGSSEIYTYTVTQDAARKPGSAGRAGLNSTIAVMPLASDDVTARAKPGIEGQVIALARSEEAFTGYLNRPDADAAVFKNGWYLTGDVGYVDAQGDLFLTGRVDDMIITGGENVMPIEIESILSLHPDVSEAIIVGRPDERLGQRITACIVPERDVCASTLDAHCRASGLPGYRCPKDYEFLQSIPKSPVGKILRRLI
jgi:2-furoate---CoA ligase